ncbi:MAG: CHAT domain-containing protein [Oscillatoriales cyanobacterium C42_A2020_001]|nr:CHAT domain-containing protein [Leptolyngbyaceae cyanobacterium C42_A2020_001]
MGKHWSHRRFFKRLVARSHRPLVLICVAIATALLCLVPVWASTPLTPTKTPSTEKLADGGDTSEPAKALYDAGRYQEAATVLEQALLSQNDPLKRAATLANLSLTYQQMGAWSQATQAMDECLNLLRSQESGARSQEQARQGGLIRAQALEVQGRLLLSQGDGEKALVVWQQAETAYQQVNNEAGVTKAQLNQAQALRSLGFSRRALEQLTRLNRTLQNQPDSRQKAMALRALGDSLQLVGDLPQSEKVLEQSLEIAQRLQLPGETSATLLSLGNTIRAQKKETDAIAYYQQAASLATTPITRVQAQLNYLNVLIDTQQWSTVQLLLPQILPNLEQLPASRAGIYARINYAQALLRLGKPVESSSRSPSDATPVLSAPSPFSVIPYPNSLSQQLQVTLQQAIQHARELKDQRAESYALGSLGAAYEQTEQFREAKEITQKALVLAQSSNTWDVAYRWQWQLGRLLRQDGNLEGAIAAYDSAIANLKSLRGDLAAISPDVQFNFRDSVEPIYRQSVELLLQSEGGNPSPTTLNKARERIEALQLAELDNFFREACLEGQRVLLDEVVDKENPTTTIVYPIVLRDRATKTVTIQVIAKIPNQELKRYPAPTLSETEFDGTLNRLQTLLAGTPTASNQRELRSQAQKVYGWLVAPIEQDIQALEATKIAAAKVDTLVFVLDDALRNLPMSLLWDGQQYLVEKYGIALSLGLQLFDPKPIAREPLKVLAAGLSEPPKGSPQEFGSLPNVQTEIDAIARLGVPTTPLLNQEFTSDKLGNKINADPFNVVHLATHGKFSSRAEDTFILAADGPINVTQFDSLLRSRDIARPEAIQLLVLSACQTATNDNRATLGLAGFAVRAGARSTLASLRNVSDESTPLLVEEFYKELNNPKETITKAEALRRAQVALLKGPRGTYTAPQYWAAYVLIGNWL